jgi:hypothetical protein
MQIQKITPLPEPDAIVTPMLIGGQTPHLQLTATHHEPAMEGAEKGYVLAPHPLQQSLGLDNCMSVRVLFDKPENNVLARYEAWGETTATGPLCVGDGQTAKILNTQELRYEQVVCRGPELCPVVREGKLQCSMAVRLFIQPEQAQSHLLHLRASNGSAYRALLSDLQKARAEHGRLRGLTFSLSVQRKSSMASGFDTYPVPRLEVGPDQNPAMPPDSDWEAHGDAIASTWYGEVIATESESAAYVGPKHTEFVNLRTKHPRPAAAPATEQEALAHQTAQSLLSAVVARATPIQNQ